MKLIIFIVAGLMMCQFLTALTIWKMLQTLKAMNITIGHLIRAQWPRGDQ